MLFNSYSMGIMRTSLNGLSLQQDAILQNIANLDTPGYKSKSVSFEDILHGKDGKYNVKAYVTTDESTSMRADGNNVDADNESMKLYENYVRQLYLYQKITGQFSNIRYVLSQSAK